MRFVWLLKPGGRMSDFRTTPRLIPKKSGSALRIVFITPQLETDKYHFSYFILPLTCLGYVNLHNFCKSSFQ